ncbi:MAG: hypothetical protein IT381_05110 [Deltaproteobacteria bacterium]|nr:hypothetical protein [Deltaproteobacteria bacterium]
MLRPLCFAFALSIISCGEPPNHLKGSVLEVHDMTFTSVSISRIDNYLVIEYQKGADGAGGKVAKLSVYVADLTIAPGNSVDLTLAAPGTNPRATLQRIVEGTIDLGVERGSITFDKAPDPGAETSGKFSITTKAPAGRNLNGNFKATVVQK